MERKISLPFPELDKVDGWFAPHGTIGLDDVVFDLPLEKPNFEVIRATLIHGDSQSAFSVTIDRAPWAEQGTAVDYETDSIALDVLGRFWAYIAAHPHEVCLREYRRRQAAEREADASPTANQLVA